MENFRFPQSLLYLPGGTPNNHFLMDGNGETTIFYVMIWNHPIETTIYKWLFGVPGGSSKTKCASQLVPTNLQKGKSTKFLGRKAGSFTQTFFFEPPSEAKTDIKISAGHGSTTMGVCFPTQNDQNLGCEMGGTTISGNTHFHCIAVVRLSPYRPYITRVRHWSLLILVPRYQQVEVNLRALFEVLTRRKVDGKEKKW